MQASGPVVLSGTGRVIGAKGRLGSMVCDGIDVWRATSTADGPATVRLRPDGDRLVAEAWGPGAGLVVERAEGLAGLDDDPGALVPRHPAVAQAVRRRSADRFVTTGTVWEHLVPTILAQKVQTAMAGRSWQAIVARWGETPPGPAPPHLRMVPSAARLAGVPYHELHRYGVERRRADTIRRAARVGYRIEESAVLPAAEARRRLETIPGIGVWSSAIVTQLSHGDPDAVIVGDFHVPHVVAWNLAGEPRATDERMLELLEPYRGQRARVQMLLKMAGEAAPKYGPRLDLVDFRAR